MSHEASEIEFSPSSMGFIYQSKALIGNMGVANEPKTCFTSPC